MQRRNFFKMIGAVIAGAVAAPLLKLAPKLAPKPIEMRTLVGSVIPVRFPQRFTVNAEQLFPVHFEWDSYDVAVRQERA